MIEIEPTDIWSRQNKKLECTEAHLIFKDVFVTRHISHWHINPDIEMRICSKPNSHACTNPIAINWDFLLKLFVTWLINEMHTFCTSSGLECHVHTFLPTAAIKIYKYSIATTEHYQIKNCTRMLHNLPHVQPQLIQMLYFLVYLFNFFLDLWLNSMLSRRQDQHELITAVVVDGSKLSISLNF